MTSSVVRRLAVFLALIVTMPAHGAGPYRELAWEALIPKGWNPSAEFSALEYSRMNDADPRAMAALERLRERWDKAPVEATLAGQKVRIPGFAIPLERKGERVVEFLLVPYFGACIHTPPPPANQIIHAVSPRPLGKMMSMQAFWVSGQLGISGQDTDWGRAGYRLTVDRIEPYEIPAHR